MKNGIIPNSNLYAWKNCVLKFQILILNIFILKLFQTDILLQQTFQKIPFWEKLIVVNFYG